MPIQTACDDCGKIYSVPSAMAGKRAKCKACGNTFTVLAPAARAVPPALPFDPPLEIPMAPAPAPRRPVRQTEVFQPPVTAVIAAPHPVDTVLDHAGKFYPTGWVLLGCLILAVIVGWGTRHSPDAWWFFAAAFPVLAGVFFAFGTLVFTAKAARSPGQLRLPIGEIIVLAVQVLLAMVLPIMVISLRKKMFKEDSWGTFYRDVGNLFVRSLAVLIMPLVMVAIAIYSGGIPSNPDVNTVTLNRLAKEQEARGPGNGLGLPPGLGALPVDPRRGQRPPQPGPQPTPTPTPSITQQQLTSTVQPPVNTVRQPGNAARPPATLLRQPNEPPLPTAEETAAAVRRIQTYWQPTTAVPHEILPAMTGPAADASGVVNLPVFKTLLGADRVGPPVTYRIICLTRGQDFRITYGSQAIFNWEMDASQFRIDFGPTGSQHKAGTGAVTADQWVGIEMVVLPKQMVLYVDGQERFRTTADFSTTVTNLHIENHGNRRMLVQSVQMLRPEP